MTISRLLDGLPLALELAAAGLRRLSLPQLQTHLESHALSLQDDAIRPERQTTLMTTIDWSYELLDPATQTLFTRLAVFVGGWTSEAVQRVCIVDTELQTAVTDSLTVLLDHHVIMLRRSTDSAPRYTMLDTVHEYAQARFEAHPERDQVEYQHLAYYVKVAEQAAGNYRRAHETAWLNTLETEHSNLRMAMQWAHRTGQSTIALHLVGLLGHFWTRRGHWHEGLHTYAVITDATQHEPTVELLEASMGILYLLGKAGELVTVQHMADTTLRLGQTFGNQQAQAMAHLYLGMIAQVTKDNDAVAEHHFNTGEALYEQCGDISGVGSIRYRQWTLAAQRGEATSGSHWLEEGVELDRQTGDLLGLAQTLNDLGAVRAEVQGRYAEARTLTEEGLALFRAAGDVWGTCYSLRNLGEILVAQGELAAAQQLFEESLATAQRFQHIVGMGTAYFELGTTAWVKGDFALAQAHFEASLRLANEAGVPWGKADASLGLGHVAYRQGDQARARTLYTDAIKYYRQRQLDVQTRIPLIGLAWAYAVDNPVWAARALGSVEVLLQSPDAYMSWFASDRVVVAEIRAMLDTVIQDSAFMAARNEGQRTPCMRVADEVLRDELLATRTR